MIQVDCPRPDFEVEGFEVTTYCPCCAWAGREGKRLAAYAEQLRELRAGDLQQPYDERREASLLESILKVSESLEAGSPVGHRSVGSTRAGAFR